MKYIPCKMDCYIIRLYQGPHSEPGTFSPQKATRGYNVLAPIRYLGCQANVPAPRDATPRDCAPPPSICQLDPPPVTRHPACPQQRVSPPGRNRLPTTSMKYLGYCPTS